MKTINFKCEPDFEELAAAGIELICSSSMNYEISDEDYQRLEEEFPAAFEDSFIVEELKDIADEYGLEYVETTDQRNGYPSNIKGAIIGMESFEQAEKIAAKYNLDIELITKHDGWQLWYRTGDWMSEPLKITEDIFGDDYRLITADDADGYFENEIKPMFEDSDDFFDAMDVITEGKITFDALNTMGEDEAVLTCNGVYEATIKLHPMQFSWDTKTDAIALINRNN